MFANNDERYYSLTIIIVYQNGNYACLFVFIDKSADIGHAALVYL